MAKTRRHHNLPEVLRPNLLEDIFPHDLPPRIRFDGPAVEYIDGKPVQFDFASVKDRDIVITDTTFRDGQQSLPPYSDRPDGENLRSALASGRAQRRDPPDRVLPLHQERPADPGQLPRARAQVSRVHRLDPGRQRRLPAGQGSRAQGNRPAHQLLRLSHFPQAQVPQPQGMHGLLLRGGPGRVRRGRAAALPPGGRHPGGHRPVRPAVRGPAHGDERGRAGGACPSRSACATRWASASATPGPSCPAAFRS